MTQQIEPDPSSSPSAHESNSTPLLSEGRYFEVIPGDHFRDAVRFLHPVDFNRHLAFELNGLFYFSNIQKYCARTHPRPGWYDVRKAHTVEPIIDNERDLRKEWLIQTYVPQKSTTVSVRNPREDIQTVA